MANFTIDAFPGSHRDGAYSWNIACVANPVAVPAVWGVNETVAAQIISAAGLVPVKTAQNDPTCSAAFGTVANQDQGDGVVVERGATVRIAVWKKPAKCTKNPS